MRKTLSLTNKLLLAKKYPRTALQLFTDGVKDKLNLHGKISAPPNIIVLYVTEMCNLRCPMCAVWQSRDQFGKKSEYNRFYTFEEVKDMVSQVEAFKPMFYLIGGEPTLNQDLIKMISYIHKKGMITQITTNGWFLSQKAQQILDSGLDLISISLDGPRPEIHDKNRGVKGVFNRATDGIKTLVEIKRKNHSVFPHVSINTAITPWNIDTLEEMVKLGKELGVDEMSFQNFSFFGKKIKKINDAYVKKHKTGEILMGMPIPGTTPFSKSQIKQVIKFLDSLPAFEKKYHLRLYSNHNVTSYDDYYQGKYPSASSFCFRPWHVATIRGSGDFEVCQGYVAGNIRKAKIMDLWNNDKYQYFRKIIKKNHITPACYRCCFLNYCFN